MKKLMFVVAFCVSVFLANAQVNQGATQGTQTVKAAQKPDRTPIKEADLLQPIKADLAKNFAGAKFDKAFKVDSKGVVTYKVMVTMDSKKWALTYDKDGKFLKKAEAKGGKKKTGTTGTTNQ